MNEDIFYYPPDVAATMALNEMLLFPLKCSMTFWYAFHAS